MPRARSWPPAARGPPPALGIRLGAARARLLEGRALAAAGQRDDAVDALAMAYAELDACGAGGLQAEAARALRELGQVVGRRGRRGAGPDDGLAALSAREREVAALVAAGDTNRQIAGRLHLSENTVETHVRRIFRKLGISSRATRSRRW